MCGRGGGGGCGGSPPAVRAGQRVDAAGLERVGQPDQLDPLHHPAGVEGVALGKGAGLGLGRRLKHAEVADAPPVRVPQGRTGQHHRQTVAAARHPVAVRGPERVAPSGDVGAGRVMAEHQEEHQAAFSSSTMPAPVIEAGAK